MLACQLLRCKQYSRALISHACVQLHQISHFRAHTLISYASVLSSALRIPFASTLNTLRLQTNVSACKSIGIPFLTQIQRIFDDMLSIYRLISSSITSLVAEQGADVLKQPLLKQMRAVKRETLTVLSTWISRAETDLMAPRDSRRKIIQLQETMALVVIPALFTTILQDYSMSVPEAREPKVLSLLSITILSLRVRVHAYLRHYTQPSCRKSSHHIWSACLS